MAAAARPGDGRAFSVSRVISEAFGVLADNPVATLGIAFLLGALPQLLFQYFTYGARANPQDNAIVFAVLSIASLPFSLFFMALVQGALTRATLAFAQGSRASFGESITAGFVKGLPLVGLILLMALALMFGLLLFVVPGVMLYVAWSVACPALVAEDLGVFEAFGRSAYLTKGARWRIFGLLLLLLVMLWIFGTVAGLFLTVTGGLQSAVAGLGGDRPPIGYLLFTTVTGTLSTAISASLQTSLYVALRDWKEGPRVDALADIFA